MAQQTVSNGDGGLSARTKINENFAEVYLAKWTKGSSYAYAGQSVFQVPQITPGPTSNGRPIEFINVGYTGHEPTSERHNVPCGIAKSNWSMTLVHNWKWDAANNRPDTADYNFPTCACEAGGEGFSIHTEAQGSNWYAGKTITTLFSGNGPRGVPGYTSGRVIQHMGTIYAHYSTDSFQSGKLRSWEGSTAPLFRLHVEETKGSSAELQELGLIDGNANFGAFNFARSQGTNAAKTIIATSQTTGRIGWKAYDGADYELTATIEAVTEGTMASNSVGQALVFKTSASNTASLAERMRITKDGYIVLANLPTSSAGLGTGTLWNNAGVLNVA